VAGADGVRSEQEVREELRALSEMRPRQRRNAVTALRWVLGMRDTPPSLHMAMSHWAQERSDDSRRTAMATARNATPERGGKP